MGFFGLFSNRGGSKTADPAPVEPESPSTYSGMRMEILSEENELLFVARLAVSPGGLSQLQQVSESAVDMGTDPFPVRLRGFQAQQQKAIHMTGVITWLSPLLWRVEELRVTGKDNDRAFFRQSIDKEGEVTKLKELSSPAVKCDVMNISAGGACIRAGEEFVLEEKLSLRSKLTPNRDISPLICAVRRITLKKKNLYEYGCEFVDLNPATEDQLSRAIMEMQMKRVKR